MSKRNQWVDQYIHRLDRHGISSPESYLYDVTGEDDQPEQLDEYLSEINFKGLTRFMPGTDQDIASVFTNPKLSFKGEVSENTNVKLSNESVESEAFSELCWEVTVGWIREKEKIRDEYYEIIRALSLADLVSPSEVKLQSEKTVEGDGFDEYLDGEFFNQMYLTNWFKLATPSDEDIPSNIKEDDIVTDVLIQELHEVDPELVMVFGSSPWKQSFRDTVDPVTTDSTPSGICAAHGHLFRDPREKMDCFVIPIIHPSAWNRNLHNLAPKHSDEKTKHGKKEAKKRLENSLNYVSNSSINI